MTPWEKIITVRSVQKVTVSQKAILLIIATHLGNNDFCFLSADTLADECCISRRRIISNIKELVALGILYKKSPDQNYRSNQYQINFESNLFGTAALNGVTECHFRGDDAVLSGDEMSPVTAPNSPISNQKQDKSDETSPQNIKLSTDGVTKRHGRGDETSPLVRRNVTPDVTKRHPKRKLKESEKKEKEPIAPASQSRALSLFDFVPTTEHRNLAIELNIDIHTELISFKAKAKSVEMGNIDLRFSDWLYKAHEYRLRQNSQPANELRQAAKFWGPGHEAWEALHGKRK